MKPREVSIVDLTLALGKVHGVETVEVYVTEVDVKTETLKITLTGWGIATREVEELLEHYAATIRSIDAVSASKRKLLA